MRAQAASARYERAGPGLLAATPPELDKPQKADRTWPVLYDHCQSRLQAMRTWRFSWWLHCAELARVLLPYRYKYLVAPNTMLRGTPLNDAILDSTGTLAMLVCASGMMTGLMSPSRPWFRFAVRGTQQEPDAEGKHWLDETTEAVYAVLAASNFYPAAAQMCRDLVTFATSPMLIYEDEEEIIRCYVPCAGEYMLAAGGRLSTDTIYREFTYTVAQIVDWFGLEACPPEIRDRWRSGGGSLENEFVIAHAIEPNFALQDRNGGGKTVSVLPAHFTWREVYWVRNNQGAAPLSLRGFVDKPFIAMLWSQTSNDPYGRGPSMDAYGDIAQLQHQALRQGEYIDKFVRPPMVGDIALMNQPTSIRSGDITFVNAQNGKQAFYPAFEVNPAGFGPLSDSMEKARERIREAFFVPTFLAISQMEGVQPRNELELAMRQGEKIQLLGPVIEAAERELSSGIQRISRIMVRRGRIAPLPQSLRGAPIRIQYTSIMKLAQQASETASIEQTFKFGGAMSEAALAAQLPNPLRIMDLDETLRHYGEVIGNPSKLFLPAAAVAQADAAKAKAAQGQQMLAATMPAVEAAKSLSQTDIGGGQQALAAILGNRAGPAGSGAAEPAGAG